MRTRLLDAIPLISRQTVRSLVAHELLNKFEKKAPKLIAYAVDIVVLVTGKFLVIVAKIKWDVQRLLHRWAALANLEDNSKMVLIFVVRRYKLCPYNRTKYYGVVLASKTWFMRIFCLHSGHRTK